MLRTPTLYGSLVSTLARSNASGLNPAIYGLVILQLLQPWCVLSPPGVLAADASLANSRPQNVAFNSALKLSTSIRKDLAALSASPAGAPDGSSPAPGAASSAAVGSLSASLTAFSRTIDEYRSLAKQELNPAKQEKALSRVDEFHRELAAFREEFDAVKTARDDALHSHNRTELLGRRPFVTSTPENPYAGATASSSTAYGGYGHVRNTSHAGGPTTSLGSGDVTREDHALGERSFFQSTESTLDQYIQQGQAVLNDLEIQKGALKNVQKKMYSVATTLGVSGNTIRMVERRAREDKWIFWAGVVVFFGFCWLCLHFLR